MKLLILLILLPWGVFAQGKISYKVFYDNNLEQNGLKIQLDYSLKRASDTTSFFYNNSMWGEEDLFRSISFWPEENKGSSFVMDPEHDRVKMAHKPGKKVSMTYRIKQDFKDPDYNAYFRPVVKNNYFSVLGQCLFVLPEDFTADSFDGQIEVTIEWIGFPESFKLQNTYATLPKKQKIKDDIWEGFYKSVFAGGDFRISSFTHHDKPVYFAVQGQWKKPYDDVYLFQNLELAIQSQRDFWRDYSQDYFAVIMVPTVSQNDSSFTGQNMLGTALKNGFMIQSTNNPFNDPETYMHILHHELMHNWIGGKIVNKHGALNYWFSEGFTDYYAYKNRLRIHNVSFEEWLSLFNANVVEPYWLNPEKNRPNPKIAKDYWKNRNVQKVPYQRGTMFALWLDHQILLKSDYKQSLDDVMREILKRCTQYKTKFSDEMLIDIANQYLGYDITEFFQKHIILGEDLDLLNEKWAEGFEFKLIDNIPALISVPENRKHYIVD